MNIRPEIVRNTGSLARKPNDVSENAVLYLPPNDVPAAGRPDVQSLMARCLRYKKMILLFSVAGVLGGFGVSKLQAPLYQSRAWLDIQNVNESFLDMHDVNPTASQASGQELQTQARVLQSETLRKRTVARLAEDTLSDKMPVTGRASAIRHAAYDPGSIDAASKSLQVRTSDANRIVEIVCESENPKLAADFANTLSDEFIKEGLEWHSAASERTTGWLNQQLQTLRARLQDSEEHLQAYAGKSDLVFFSSDKDNVTEEKLRQIQAELSRVQADRVVKQSRSEIASSSPSESLPEVLDSAPLREYESKVTELQRQLAELSTSFEPGYYKVQKVQAQIATLEDAFDRERANVLKRIKTEYDDAKRRESLLTESYASQARLVSEQAAKAVHYDILKREVDTNRQIYEGVLQKVKQTGVLAALPPDNVRIVDPAEPAAYPFKPKSLQNSAVGLLTGMFLGVALASVRGRSMKTFKEPGEAGTALDVPELGAIVSAEADRRIARSPALRVLDSIPGNLGFLPVDNIGSSQASLVADSFRSAAVSLRYSDCNSRVIAIVSAEPNEGKTTITANIGITLAKLDSRVLLVDSDLRHPSLHSRFGLDNTSGLNESFQTPGRAPERDFIRATPVKGLYLLPAGSMTHDTSALYSRRMAEMIERVRNEYDYVLIDTPAMLYIPDARALAKLTDGVVIVIRANQTDRDAVCSIRKRFDDDGTPVVGTILNDWNPKKSKLHYYRANSEYGSGEKTRKSGRSSE